MIINVVLIEYFKIFGRNKDTKLTDFILKKYRVFNQNFLNFKNIRHTKIENYK